MFGYTLVNDWRARDASGAPMETADGLPISLGPCVVTVDELEPQTMFLQVKVNGEEVAKGNLNGAAGNLARVDRAARRSSAGWNAATPSHSDPSCARKPIPADSCGRAPRWNWPPRASARSGTASEPGDEP